MKRELLRGEIYFYIIPLFSFPCRVYVCCSQLAMEKALTVRQALSSYISEALDHAPSLVILDDLDSIVSSSSDLEGSQPSTSVVALTEFLIDIMDEYGVIYRGLWLQSHRYAVFLKSANSMVPGTGKKEDLLWNWPSCVHSFLKVFREYTTVVELFRFVLFECEMHCIILAVNL